MRKFLLLAGIFTIFTCGQAKAEQYYEENGYYYQDEPRYVERVEYREPVRQGYRKAGYEYQESQSPRYQRIRKAERLLIKEIIIINVNIMKTNMKSQIRFVHILD